MTSLEKRYEHLPTAWGRAGHMSSLERLLLPLESTYTPQTETNSVDLVSKLSTTNLNVSFP